MSTEILAFIFDLLSAFKGVLGDRQRSLSLVEKQRLREALSVIRFSDQTIEAIKRDNASGAAFGAIRLRDSEERVAGALAFLGEYISSNNVALKLRRIASSIESQKLSIREEIRSALRSGSKAEVLDQIGKLNQLIEDLDITLLGPEIR